MTAPARRTDAAARLRTTTAHELWQDAVPIRQEWLGHGLSTRPADRPAAERGVTGIYARMSRPRPRFEWVRSPREALPLIAGLLTLDDLYRWIRDPRPPGRPPLAGDLATVVSRLRGELGAGVGHGDPELSPVRRGKKQDPWPELPPLEALALGAPLGVVLHQGIRTALHRSLAHGFRLPVRAAATGDQPLPVCWYGQHDASWIAYYDALQRLGLARYGPAESAHLGEWALLARSGGWWWPGEEVCVMVERPETVRTEPFAGAWHEEVRLRVGGVAYRDGWRPPLT